MANSAISAKMCSGLVSVIMLGSFMCDMKKVCMYLTYVHVELFRRSKLSRTQQ